MTPSLERQLKCLLIGPCKPDAFARRYFGPDHPGWKRHTRCGHGTRHGGGLVLWAGGALGKLRKMGLAEAWLRDDDMETRITASGRAVLAAPR